MIKIDIISGFLGAGKTTLIKKLLVELSSETIVVIENEFGEISIDSSVLRGSGIEIREINSGCICCSLVGDFRIALKDILKRYHPDRVIIEPSGVGKLSDVVEACRKTASKTDLKINMCIAVVDALKYQMYLLNFSEFFKNQIEHAQTVVLSRTQKADPQELDTVVKDIRKLNPRANIITTPWEEIAAQTILSVAQQDAGISLKQQLEKEIALGENQEQFHELSSNKSHIDHQGPAHRHHHHAEAVFQVWSTETPRVFSVDAVSRSLEALSRPTYGNILRAKGILPVDGGSWIQFDLVPGEIEVKPTTADYTGRLCVIGENLNKPAIAELFQV